MTSNSHASISSLPRGHEFEPAQFALSPAAIDSYVRAVGDVTQYGDRVPPLAAVALGLAALQAQIALPEGSLHTGQEVEHQRAARAAAALRLTGRVAQRSERQGFVISVLEFEISDEEGVAVRARTTIMAPGAA
jgi:hypothetical protein